ncbi:MAG TPA: dimethylmenaquinone methyltransferase [Bauldia sp.]|nr:dimethylmenaquinone methyltransferase [Bauldia sp.]
MTPIAEKLAAFDTATLHESGAGTVMSPAITMVSGGRRVAGPAYTVMCPPGDNLMIHVGLARTRPGMVLVVQTHDAGYGVWGEVLTVAAQSLGVVALVVDGSVRDLGGIRELGFPVFSRGIAIRGTVKASRGTIEQPITCGGVPVWQGDLIVADESGIVVIPPANAEAILARAEARVKKEAAMMEQLRAGKTTMDLLGLKDPS